MIIGNKNFKIGERTFLMGILNATPDSFFKESRKETVNAALENAFKMQQSGADLIDVGGESTRPGYQEISAELEKDRIIPIIKSLKNALDTPISVDTYKADVAESAIINGAGMVNDIWGLKADLKMKDVIKKYDVACCLMHNRKVNDYNNFLDDVINDLKESIRLALSAGIKKEKIMIDPGIGFAKDFKQNLEILRNLKKFKMLGFPILLATSRKSFIGKVLNEEAEERLEGTLATTALGIKAGCDFFRVHDIKENKRIATMADAICR